MPPEFNEIPVNDWIQYKQLVFAQLKELAIDNKEIKDAQSNMREDIVRLQSAIESHPINCPINKKEVSELVKTEIMKQASEVKKEGLDKKVNWVNIVFMLVMLVVSTISLAITLRRESSGLEEKDREKIEKMIKEEMKNNPQEKVNVIQRNN